MLPGCSSGSTFILGAEMHLRVFGEGSRNSAEFAHVDSTSMQAGRNSSCSRYHVENRNLGASVAAEVLVCSGRRVL